MSVPSRRLSRALRLASLGLGNGRFLADRWDDQPACQGMISNTAPFDITHHPAMAVPCGMSDGLPVSLMLVGKHWDEPTIYKAAFAYEQSGDWKKL